MTRSMAVVVVLSALIGAAAGDVSGQGGGQAGPEKFVLSGVVVLGEDKGLAWLQEPTLTGDRVVVVRPGGSVGPYRLTRILDDRVELEGPAGKLLVPLFGGAPGTAVAATPVGVTRTAPSRPDAATPAAAPAAPRAATPTAAPAAAARTTPPVPIPSPSEVRVPPGLDAETTKALRERLEAARKQAAAAAAAAANGQGRAPQPSAGSAEALANPFPNNPNMIYLQPGDPRRRQGFGSMPGGK